MLTQPCALVLLLIQTFSWHFTFFDSALGVPSTLLFIFWFWLTFSMPNSGLGVMPGGQKGTFVRFMHWHLSTDSSEHRNRPPPANLQVSIIFNKQYSKIITVKLGWLGF